MATGALMPLSFISIIALLSSTQIRARENGFQYAALETSTWKLKALTDVRWPYPKEEGSPFVGDVECFGSNPHLQFSMNGDGQIKLLHIHFFDTEDHAITVISDHIYLYIDGERWEYVSIPKRLPEFSNVAYPPLDPNLEILPVWRGHQAVRRRNTDPWLHLTRIYEKIINAKKIEWGFKSRDPEIIAKNATGNRLPVHWQTTRYRVDNSGLNDAVSWCAHQVLSEAAYILPDALKQDIIPQTGGGSSPPP